MASPANEGGFRLVVCFASECSPGVSIRGEIGMTSCAGKRAVNGALELLGVDISLDEFAVLECHHEAVLRMTG
jgi:hypothetical protein